MDSFKQKCESCGCEYEYNYKHIYSKDIKELCLYYGCCKYDCWADLPMYDRNLLSVNAFIHSELMREEARKKKNKDKK